MTRSFWMLVALLAALGGLRASPFLLLAAILLTALGAVVHLWGRYALRGVECRRTITPTHVEVGETARVEIEVANSKGLPLPWLRVDAPLPAALRLENEGKSNRSISYLVRLAPNDRATERAEVRVRERGIHDLGPTWLRTADPLGFKIVRSRIPTDDRLVGLPPVVALERLGFGLGTEAAGLDTRAVPREFRQLLLDSVNTWEKGSDQDRSISGERSLVLIPDLRGANGLEVEWVLSAARSIAKAALAGGHEVALETGAFRSGTQRRILVRPGRGPEQEMRIGEALAALPSPEGLPTAHVIRRATRRHDNKTIIWVISATTASDRRISERSGGTLSDALDAAVGQPASGHMIEFVRLPPPDPAFIEPRTPARSTPVIQPAATETPAAWAPVQPTIPPPAASAPVQPTTPPRAASTQIQPTTPRTAAPVQPTTVWTPPTFPRVRASLAKDRSGKDDFESWNRTVFLPLARLLLRLSWIWPWTVLLSQIAMPGMEPGVSLGALILLSWTGHALGRLRLHRGERSSRWAPFLVVTVTTLAVLATSWLLTYRSVFPIQELAWLRDLGTELLQGGPTMVRRAIAIVAAAFVCVGAVVDAEEPSDHASIWSAFVSAIALVIAQAAIVEFASDPRVHAPTSWLLFAFTVGLLALIASGVRLGHRLEPKARRPWQPG